MNPALNKHYRPDVDGLRAVAVIPVVLYHLGVALPGGYVGVDIFFVISGYLITSIILRELEQGEFSLLRFYERRVRRILPAFTFMMAGVLLAAWYLYLPYEMEQLGKHLTDISILLSNYWLKAKAGDYWSPGAEAYPLLHTWSLAVEEQFYLFMPLILISLFKWQRRWTAVWLWAGFLASLGYCILQTGKDPASAFYLLPYRAWELIMGSLLCVYSQKQASDAKPSASNLLAYLGLGFLLCSFFAFDDATLFPGYAALLPTLGAALIIYSSRSGLTQVGRALAWVPMRAVGLISYSLYLWHWPLIVFYKSYRYPGTLSKSDQAIILVLSILLAAVSWKFVEQPFRKNSKTLSPWIPNIAGAALLAAMLVVSLGIRKLDGYPKRFEGRVPPELYNVVQSDVLDKKGSGKYQAGRHFLEGGLQENVAEGSSPRWVLLGDSHGAMFAPVLADLAREQNIPVAFFTQDGRNLLTEPNPRVHEAVFANLREWQADNVFIVLRWDGIFPAGNSTAIESLTEWLHFASNQSKLVHVALQVPMISTENLRSAKIIYNRALRNDGNLPVIAEMETSYLARKQALDFLQELKIDNLRIHDFSQPFLDQGHVLYHDGGRMYYRDNDHLNLFGAMQVKDLLIAAISPDSAGEYVSSK